MAIRDYVPSVKGILENAAYEWVAKAAGLPLVAGAATAIGSWLLSAPWWAAATLATVVVIAVEGFMLIWLVHRQEERLSREEARALMLMPEEALDELLGLLNDAHTSLGAAMRARTPEAAFTAASLAMKPILAFINRSLEMDARLDQELRTLGADAGRKGHGAIMSVFEIVMPREAEATCDLATAETAAAKDAFEASILKFRDRIREILLVQRAYRDN